MEPKTWDAKTKSRKGNASEKYGNPSLPRDPPPFQGRPREGVFRRPPVAEFGCGAPSFDGDTEGCCVGQAWRGRAALRGRVAVGRAGVPRSILKLT